LDWGHAVAEGKTPLSERPLLLDRESLVEVDEAIIAHRRAYGAGSASRSDTSLVSASAGFFLAVVLHELEANALEVAPDDGGCKVTVPSGAGAMPVLLASAFAEGTGPSLVQTFDRLATTLELAADSGRPASSGVRPPSSPALSAAVGAPQRGIGYSAA